MHRYAHRVISAVPSECEGGRISRAMPVRHRDHHLGCESILKVWTLVGVIGSAIAPIVNPTAPNMMTARSEYGFGRDAAHI
jgi:hypothetical protein